nr:MAG TPA: tail assembly chaperone protein [Caudoviricetes sp.]
MGMTANIEIDGKQVPFRASAAIPRIYRIRFHRDIYKDLKSLEGAVDNNDAENSTLDSFSLEMFENIAYVMAKHADKSIPDSPEEWLDQFNTFSIYQVLPKIIKLWGLNVQTDVASKKNFTARNGK